MDAYFKMTDKKIQGKKARAAGARFELKVRADLEKKGWIVDKWSNNVEFNIEMQGISNQIIPDEVVVGKLVKVKNKFLGPGKPIMLGAGFPDFIAFVEVSKSLKGMKFIQELVTEDSMRRLNENIFDYIIIGVEVKSNGYLDKEEKEKCKWLLDNNIFSKILIAKKGKKRGEIIYEKFKTA